MPEHTRTPGRYSVMAGTTLVCDRNQRIVCDCSRSVLPLATQIANAEFLAAAPALEDALYALLGDLPYVCSPTECECGAFEESGTCLHQRAHALLASVSEQGVKA